MKWIVTGAAGFIGCNVVSRLLQLGHQVVAIDNLSRRGTKTNLEWLRNKGSFKFFQQDIRNFTEISHVIEQNADADVLLHLAGQVAVTTSVRDPREDFDINALGTFNLLEAVRLSGSKPAFLYASTNKVYGDMEHVKIRLDNNRYTYTGLSYGIDEDTVLDFHSPYGCSKGAGDQYVRDYARIYGLKTVVFRQSCIYGPRQFGIEDQGWVAWFIISSLFNHPITIYGDGRQVRDVLYVEDLIDCYLKAVNCVDQIKGQIFNIGGGPSNQLSLLELVSWLENALGRSLDVNFVDWRPGDQRVFIADITKAKQKIGWEPQIEIAEGLDKLFTWIKAERHLIASELGDRLR